MLPESPGERRPLGPTSVTTSALALGGVPFGDMFAPVTDEAAVATIQRAFEVGVRFFDAAPIYGPGKAERRLGLGLQAIDRASVTVATKVGRVLGNDETTMRLPFDYSRDGVLRSIEGSLGRLRIDRVDVVHVHDPDDHMDAALDGAFPTLRQLQSDGVIGAVSAGMNNSEPLARFVSEGVVDCVLVAGRYTLLDQSALADLLPAALSNGVSVLAAGVFNSGVLADPDGDPRLVNFNYAPASDEVVAHVRRLRDICSQHGVSLRAAALQFPFTHPAVASVVVGCRSPEEVEHNSSDLVAPIPDDLWRALEAEGSPTPA